MCMLVEKTGATPRYGGCLARGVRLLGAGTIHLSTGRPVDKLRAYPQGKRPLKTHKRSSPVLGGQASGGGDMGLGRRRGF